jgi:hypothetical protein
MKEICKTRASIMPIVFGVKKIFIPKKRFINQRTPFFVPYERTASK